MAILCHFYSSISTVLAGAVWGDHYSPLSFTTILSAMASRCEPVEHVRTQLAGALLLGTLPTGYVFFMVDCPNLGNRSVAFGTSHLWQKNLINKFTGMMSNFWSYLLHQIQSDHRVFLALVASHTQGSPGTTGAKMFISETGEIQGTIGGGIMEYKLIDRAKEILKQEDFKPQIQTLYHRASGSGEKSGMICSGSQTNLYYLCRPSRDRETIEQLVFLMERDIFGSLLIDLSGMSMAEKAVNLAQPAIQLIQESGRWKYEEQLLNRQRIAIIGGGHCSLALSRVMSQLNYNVLVFDTRREVSTLTQNNYARSVKIVENYREVGALIPFPQLTCVVVMTTDFPSDIRALLGVTSFPFPFIGVMGSHAKIATIFEQLRQAEISKNVLSRLYAPVGLSISSHTPEEIAISIAAQILQERNKWHNP